MTTTTLRRSRHTARRRLLVVVAAAAVLLGGGVAWAAWTATGTGTAAAQAVTATVAAVTPGTPTASLYPRPTAGYPTTGPGSIVFTVNNPNPYSVTYNAIALGAVTSGNEGACPATNVVPATPTPTVSITVAPNATSTLQTVPAALSMLQSAPNGCQGVTFTVAVTLTGTSVPA